MVEKKKEINDQLTLPARPPLPCVAADMYHVCPCTDNFSHLCLCFAAFFFFSENFAFFFKNGRCKIKTHKHRLHTTLQVDAACQEYKHPPRPPCLPPFPPPPCGLHLLGASVADFDGIASHFKTWQLRHIYHSLFCLP